MPHAVKSQSETANPRKILSPAYVRRSGHRRDEYASPMHSDVTEAQARVVRMVEEKRAAGDYPPNLEHDLDQYYRGIMLGLTKETERVLAIRTALNYLGDPTHFDPTRIPNSSTTVFRNLVHRIIARLASRQVHTITSQIRDLAAAVHIAITNLTKIIETIKDTESTQAERRLIPLEERICLLEDKIRELERENSPR